MDSEDATYMGFATSLIVLLASITTLYYIKNKKKQQTTAVDTSTDKESVEVRLYFGTQTGTSEDFANQSSNKLSELSNSTIDFKCEVVDLEDFSKEDLEIEGCFHVFLLATYGEGDPTDNAREFFKWLKAKPTISDSFQYAVFGLGNKEYEQYNFMGKKCFELLGLVGGQHFLPYMEGNDADDMELDFTRFEKQLVMFFQKKYLKTSDTAKIEKKKEEHPSKNKLIFVENPTPQQIDPSKISFSSKHFFENKTYKIAKKYELRKNAVQTDIELGSTLHIDFDIESDFQTAGNFGILSKNDPSLVQECLDHLDLQSVAEQVLQLVTTDRAPFVFPLPCTVKDVFTKYILLNHSPSRNLLRQLAFFAALPEHASRLMFLASEEGSADYKKLILDRQIDLIEIFEKFPSINSESILKSPQNTAYFFEVLPKLQPRWYTVSSSSKLDPSKLSITISKVSEPKKYLGNVRRRFEGVCTTYLDRARVGDNVRAVFNHSAFKLPEKVTQPLVMIGPGTGIAPMRAFLEELKHLGVVGKAHLFFGSRHPEEDFLYEDELDDFVQSGVLSKLYTAFSRKTDKKVYVQNLLADQTQLFEEVTDSGCIFVCGGTNMGRDVQKEIEGIVGKQKVKQMIDENRYVQELWS